MVAKQVIFKELYTGEELTMSGIALYEDFGQGKDFPALELKGIICGECGEWLDLDGVEIISTLDQWWTLDEAIRNNIAPDGTRGFRLENQISMKFD